jgi:hypothetical protein
VATPHTPQGRGARFTRRAAAALAAATAAVVLQPGSSVLAQPGSVPSQALASAPNPGKKWKDLQKRAGAMEKDYRGSLEILGDAQKGAKRATAQAARTRQDLAAAQVRVRRLAAAAYMAGGLDSAPVLLGSIRRGGSVGGATAMEYLARDNTRRIQGLARLAADAEQARGAAQSRIGQVRAEVATLDRQRSRVRRLLAAYKPQTPVRQPAAGPPAGAPATAARSPIAGSTMTARMRNVLLDVDRRFGPFSTIGCYRPGDPQDHGSGHACDFMESTGGGMPSAAATAHGTSVAQYVISNASRLGIKYVIWRQRIYDMRSPGWRGMEDRGGITANHYDHVHVSVF